MWRSPAIEVGLYPKLIVDKSRTMRTFVAVFETEDSGIKIQLFSIIYQCAFRKTAEIRPQSAQWVSTHFGTARLARPAAGEPLIVRPWKFEDAAVGRTYPGVTAPVLTLPEAFLLRNATLGRTRDLQLYILINNKAERDFQLVPKQHDRHCGAILVHPHEDADALDPLQEPTTLPAATSSDST